MTSGTPSSPNTALMLSAIQLDPSSKTPLYKQIYNGLRDAILTQQLAPGFRLPSTRDLAPILGVSRNTIRNAFDQLFAEGYLESAVGSGTFVSQQLPDDLLPSFRQALKKEKRPFSSPIAQRAERYAAIGKNMLNPDVQAVSPLFPIGSPALDAFPFDVWAKLTARFYKQLDSKELQLGQHMVGYPPLRQAIANYLKATRGVDCQPEQIIITSGSQLGLYVSAQVLINAGDSVWVENPGYSAAWGAVDLAGGAIKAIPVDEEGLVVETGIAQAENGRVAIVTPSHQYPLGYTMSLARRLQLLNWASSQGAWIIEDDYDSAYRYNSPPLAALQALDPAQRVIYVGTFSKMLFPALRLGFLVVPPDLLPAFVGLRTTIDVRTPIISQAVLAAFLSEGHFMRHLRRMRKLYQTRRDCLITELQRQLGDIIGLGPTDCGMHFTLFLPDDLPQDKINSGLLQQGWFAEFLSHAYLAGPQRNGIGLGYTSLNPEQIRHRTHVLAQAILRYT
ncbi:MAG: PLP-dependent aminotransferase family protein [Chloroflexota bacterium]